MNKSELVASIAQKVGSSKKSAEENFDGDFSLYFSAIKGNTFF